jgi:hypothetical protein
MDLPKVQKKKLIDEKKFVRNAKKVQESFKKELEFLLNKKLKNGHNIPPGSIIVS